MGAVFRQAFFLLSAGVFALRLFAQNGDFYMPAQNGDILAPAQRVGPPPVRFINSGGSPDEQRAIMAESMADFAEARANRERRAAEAEEAAQAQAEALAQQSRDGAEHDGRAESQAKPAENGELGAGADGAGQPQPEAQQAAIPAQKSAREKLIDSLLERNPFFASQSRRAGGVIQEAPAGLELRSVSCVNGKWLFGIADTQQKKNYVIALGRAGAGSGVPYTVDFYDDETNSISISDNMGIYTLTLKEPDAPKGKAVTMYGKSAAPSARAVPAAQRRAAARR
ncbi:MAG: hypothetical protein DBX55_03050 [Verrucomicrobia bacterium]|nr:MAG: hypothetical protein DBX55_03050 [Verrucomicrobiota bacterium]